MLPVICTYIQHIVKTSFTLIYLRSGAFAPPQKGDSDFRLSRIQYIVCRGNQLAPYMVLMPVFNKDGQLHHLDSFSSPVASSWFKTSL